MRWHISPLIVVTVKVKYCFKRGGTYYWQRVIPTKHRSRYASSAPLKQNLHTLDPAVAARKAEKLNAECEAVWAAMDRDATITPPQARDAGGKLLRSEYGITNLQDACPDALDAFYERLDAKRGAYALRQFDSEYAYYHAPETAFLDHDELAAIKAIHSKDLFLLSDAIEVYLQEHPQRGGSSFDGITYDARTQCNRLIKLLGDKELTAYTRDDAKAFRDYLLGTGVATRTVERYLKPVMAVFRKAKAEKSLQMPDIWEKMTIEGLGQDSTPRASVEQPELERLREACRTVDDDIRWLIALQVDTGARISEVAGLRLQDIHTNAPVPFVDFVSHPARGFKTACSVRKVPLVGAALWAAKRIHATATKGQELAFPRYLREKTGRVSGDATSSAVNSWLESRGFAFTSHSLRHAMKDRLVNANATKQTQDAILGHAREDVGDEYGRGSMLARLQNFLERSLHSGEGGTWVAVEHPAMSP